MRYIFFTFSFTFFSVKKFFSTKKVLQQMNNMRVPKRPFVFRFKNEK